MNKKLLNLKKNHFGKTYSNLFSFKELEKLINLRPFIIKERLMYTAKVIILGLDTAGKNIKILFPYLF